MTGPPERDGFRNVQVCLVCVVQPPEYDEMFPVGRIYCTATQADMLKLASEFGAELNNRSGQVEAFLESSPVVREPEADHEVRTHASSRALVKVNCASELVLQARAKAGCI